uniref:ABC transmembrane type-1 domain-containing protein n=1 Tax=Globodera pallida TaxID=36090 RepID=A0A183BNH6_GLOPA
MGCVLWTFLFVLTDLSVTFGSICFHGSSPSVGHFTEQLRAPYVFNRSVLDFFVISVLRSLFISLGCAIILCKNVRASRTLGLLSQASFGLCILLCSFSPTKFLALSDNSGPDHPGIIFSGDISLLLANFSFAIIAHRLLARLEEEEGEGDEEEGSEQSLPQNGPFASLVRQDVAFFDRHKTGEITSRLTADTTTMSDTIALNVNIFLRNTVQMGGSMLFMMALFSERKVQEAVAHSNDVAEESDRVDNVSNDVDRSRRAVASRAGDVRLRVEAEAAVAAAVVVAAADAAAAAAAVAVAARSNSRSAAGLLKAAVVAAVAAAAAAAAEVAAAAGAAAGADVASAWPFANALHALLAVSERKMRTISSAISFNIANDFVSIIAKTVF